MCPVYLGGCRKTCRELWYLKKCSLSTVTLGGKKPRFRRATWSFSGPGLIQLLPEAPDRLRRSRPVAPTFLLLQPDA
jgi:hypothetical protein